MWLHNIAILEVTFPDVDTWMGRILPLLNLTNDWLSCPKGENMNKLTSITVTGICHGVNLVVKYLMSDMYTWMHSVFITCK